MNEATDYVHTHVINYEPTYLVLSEVVERYRDDDYQVIEQLERIVAESVERATSDMNFGLSTIDATDDDVDYAAMIEFEASE